MKKLFLFSLWSVFFVCFGSIQPTYAQSNHATQMSYKVTFGPVFPIEGQSNQFKGELGLNDTTGAVEKLNFEVPLISFQGTNGGYLAWVANSWYNPDMSFKSSSIHKKDNHWVAKGTLEFRRRTNPVEIEFYLKNMGNEILVEGHFELRPRDYFFSSPPFDLVPSTIPVKFTMLYDQPEKLKGEEIGMTTGKK